MKIKSYKILIRIVFIVFLLQLIGSCSMFTDSAVELSYTIEKEVGKMKETQSTIRTFSFHPKANGEFTIMFVPSHPLRLAELKAASVPAEAIKRILAPYSELNNQGKYPGQLIVVDKDNPTLSRTTYHLKFVNVVDTLLTVTKQKDSANITLEIIDGKVFLTKLK
jgi:hypothetical protein